MEVPLAMLTQLYNSTTAQAIQNYLKEYASVVLGLIIDGLAENFAWEVHETTIERIDIGKILSY
jgi:hypothetical protein